jgi:ABC-type transport system involved in multi-copper enzyme maturation permease subunit
VTRVIRSELLKIRTTNVWWLLLVATLVMTALALTIGVYATSSALEPPAVALPPDVPPEQAAAIRAEQERTAAEARSSAALAVTAANFYTAGQFFGSLFVMLLGMLVVTNEFFHQTATTTFLTTPRRTQVIVGKLITAMMLGAGFWAITTAMDLAVGVTYLRSHGFGSQLDQWPVLRSILLNLAAYAVWTLFGVGFGTLLRSQIWAVVTGTVLYLLSFPVVTLVVGLVRNSIIREDWVYTAQVAVPSIASLVMTTAEEPFEHAPPQWVGALVLIGYGVAAAVVGTLVTRRRDIS